MNPTNTTTTPLVIRSAEEIYDLIMQQVEPDLMITSLPTLEEKYRDELPEDTQKRAHRYEVAFAKYQEMYQEYKDYMNNEIRTFEKSTLQTEEQKMKVLEAAALREIEELIITTDVSPHAS